jgi:diguanylate cyclase (GGDEF)-like protein
MVSVKNLLEGRGAGAGPGERVSRRQYLVANLISIGLGLTAAIATPFAKLPLLPIPGTMTAFGTAMFVINILLAAFLFSKGAIEDREDAVRLGTAYFFIAAIFVPLTASFPGGIMPGPVIGTEESSIWLWCCWHLGFGLAILRYALLPQPAGPASSVLRAVSAVLAAVVLMTIGATVYIHQLPTILGDGDMLFSGRTAVLPLSVLAFLAIGTVAVARLGARTPEQLWLSVGMVAVCFDVWLTYCGAEPFSLGWYLAKLGGVFTSLTVIVSLFYDLTRLYGRLSSVNEALQDLAGRDGLTGLFNRRRLDEALALEWLRAKRERQPISVLMIDVDYFKGFNDTYGHQEGDQCLRRLAAVFRDATRRPADLVARYGGEEFLICLPATPLSGGFEVAGKIRAALGALAIPHAASPLHVVTVSMGVASLVPQDGISAEQLVAAADAGLYRAKSAGRDRVMPFDIRMFEAGGTLETVMPWAPST